MRSLGRRVHLILVSDERYTKMSLAYRSSSSLNSCISRTRYTSRQSCRMLSTYGNSKYVILSAKPVVLSLRIRPIKRMNVTYSPMILKKSRLFMSLIKQQTIRIWKESRPKAFTNTCEEQWLIFYSWFLSMISDFYKSVEGLRFC